MNELIAVTGGTGQTGRILVKRLVEEGRMVRVLCRDLDRGADMFGNSAQLVEGDLVDSADLTDFLRGVTHLVTAHGGDGSQLQDPYRRIEYEGMQKLLSSLPAGDIHLVHLSSIYVERKDPPADYAGRPIHWKKETEGLVRASGRPFTIVRPGWLFDAPGGRMAILAEQGDTGDGRITRADVAEVMLHALQEPGARGKIFEIFNGAGPRVGNWSEFFKALR